MVLASHAGFCFGVRRAVGTAEKAAPAVTLGPIIHSPQVVERLRRMGIVPVDALEEIPDGVRAVIRSHGVDRATYDALARKGCEVVRTRPAPSSPAFTTWPGRPAAREFPSS